MTTNANNINICLSGIINKLLYTRETDCKDKLVKEVKF